MRYEPVASKIEPGMFDFQGERLDIYSSTQRQVYRCFFDEERLEMIQIRDADSFQERGQTDHVRVRPATQYLQRSDNLEQVLDNIMQEMHARVADLEKANKLVEAQRLRKRVSYDVRMIRETGFVNGIENYSPYFDGRLPAEVPYTLFDYMPDDFLMIVDESHMTLPQLMAMPKADRSRKVSLATHGFRLPSAVDHRPITFQELEVMMGWADDIDDTPSMRIKKSQKNIDKDLEQQVHDFQSYRNTLFSIATDVDKNHRTSLTAKVKDQSKTLFVSATPAPYEIESTQTLVEQIIRPTGLLDPIVSVYPKSWDMEYLLESVDHLLDKKPHLKKFLNTYQEQESGEVLK